MTVKDLKEFIKDFDDHTPICVFDHYLGFGYNIDMYVDKCSCHIEPGKGILIVNDSRKNHDKKILDKKYSICVF